jgi:hypothetical protein
MRIRSLLFPVLIFASCQGQQMVRFENSIRISEKKTIYLGEVGLSSALPFPPAANLGDTLGILVLNPYRNTLDTLKSFNSGYVIKPGPELPLPEGMSTSDINFLTRSNEKLYLLGTKECVVVDITNEEVSRLRYDDMAVFEGQGYSILEGKGSFFMNHFFYGFDSDNGKIYLFLRFFPGSQFELVRYNLIDKHIEKMPHLYNRSLVERNEVVYTGIGFTTKNSMPFVNFFSNQIVISYPYSNQIEVFDKLTGSLTSHAPETIHYPSEKSEISVPLNSLSMMKALEEMDRWDMDVTYGNFHKLAKQGLYCRLVRGKTTPEAINDAGLFLEIYNSAFEKTGEIDLSNISKDLSSFLFPCGDGICFKAKHQDNEDYMNYYVLNIESPDE